ncbi:MAG TPA: tripartite tricarboxylate transporter TctB family protein [Burkholderiales bacterium]|jgi:hypothetical protein|nr:tripartite tricarboxylate transporter TctB family protein [Burkholderiales bacterium]
MAVHIKGPKDFWSGLIFAGFGVAFVAVARNYPLGSALRMGPAYFPTLVGGLLAILGVVLIARSAFTAGEAVSHIGLRALVLVLGALVLFGYLLDYTGLVPAIVALVFVSSAGGHEFKWWEVSILSVALVILAVGIFYYGLGMPLDLGPRL